MRFERSSQAGIERYRHDERDAVDDLSAMASAHHASHVGSVGRAEIERSALTARIDVDPHLHVDGFAS
jgi:hypothetical protein